ncbi:hypothetical protein [Tardiphaga sp. OK245]|uniref:hypothetical protein n=1 Tax=Tardiphaga sp. OK245 TaxID=1855306 RepID=UPI0008A7A165|nr:hypothetical protein [Tardiphaga sp. OK245]SEI19630.1 hypothetical protein SAMN05216367_4920 [Tardiphaga sp. OK245]
MNAMNVRVPSGYRSVSLVLPTSTRMQALYERYEERFGDPVRKPYPSGLDKYIPMFLSGDVEEGRPGRGVPIWENIFEVCFVDVAGDGIFFDDQDDVDLEHYAGILGCDAIALHEFRDLFNAFGVIDEDVRPFAEILRERLDDDRSKGALVLGPDGTVDIEWYADVLDSDPLLISKYHHSILVNYRVRSRRSRGAYGTITEERVRALLDRDFAAGRLKTSRGGKIDRGYYCELLGCEKSGLTKFTKTVLREYEQRVPLVSGPAKRLDEIREWLEAQYKAGLLPLIHGKIDRTFCAKHFGFSSSYPFFQVKQIADVVKELDRRVAQDGYLLRQDQSQFEALAHYLAHAPKLNRDRLTVNQTLLAKECGIPEKRLRYGRFSDIIQKHDVQYLEQAKLSRIDPYIYGRVFGFGHLEEFWSRGFLLNVADGFKNYALSNWSGKSTVNPHRHLVNMLDWIGRSNRVECLSVVQEAERYNRIITGDAWEDAFLAYDDAIDGLISSGDLSKRFASRKLTGALQACRGLEQKKTIPAHSLMVVGPKNAKRLARHLATVVNVNHEISVDDEEIRAVIGNRLLEAAASRRIEFSFEEAERFVTNMVLEVRQGRELPSNLIEAIKVVLNRRLNALRVRLIALISEAKENLELGRRLLNEADIDPAGFITRYFADGVDWRGKHKIGRAAFPIVKGGNETDRRRSLANLLAFAKACFPGMIPPQSESGLMKFFARRFLEHGGMRAIEHMLYPTAETAAAVLALYLIESGANVAVGRELKRNCIADSEYDGLKEITGVKAAAQGKPIIMHFDADDVVLSSIKWLEEETGKLALVAGEDGSRLFLTRDDGRTKMMSDHWFRNWFKAFCQSSLGLPIAPNMIRPSVLLQAALENDGRLHLGMAIGQHGLAVSQGYQLKYPVRLMYDEYIRRFQEAFETLVTSSVEDAARLLGISKDEFDRRVGALQDTGLGVFCKNRLGRPGSEGRPCIEMDCWKCTQILIVAETESIATLQLWQESLRAVQGEWERDRPERWEAMWLPWLCLADVVQEKMSRSFILIWDGARKRADAIKASPTYVPPKPW